MTRRLSCYTNAYGPAGVWVAAERIGSTGLAHLELALRGHDFGGLVIPEEVVVTERADDATARAFVDHLARHGVGVSACNVGGGDIRTVEGVALTERRIQFARRWFGVDVVVSGAGQPRDDAERRVVLDHLRRIGDTAGALGVTVALETHKGPTQNAEAMLRLMDELNHPAIRLNFDTGNIAYYNAGLDPVAELANVAPWVRNVHLKDNRGRFEDWYFPALGDGGAVDFRRIREILDAAGYTGAWTIEIEGIGGEPEPGVEARHERIRRSVEHLRACGYFDDLGQTR
jgi:L-ribulose-5-phosphate 3-epimerase